MNISTIAGFLRTLGQVAPLLGQGGVTVIANAAAVLLEAGADGVTRLEALTEEMKARHDAGVTTTAEEILADIERIKDLNQQIQDTARPG
jgi:hypothetical protein